MSFGWIIGLHIGQALSRKKREIIAWIRHPDIIQLTILVAAFSIPVIWLLIVFQILKSSLLAFRTFGVLFLTGTDWIPEPLPNRPVSIGALTPIFGSIVTTVI